MVEDRVVELLTDISKKMDMVVGMLATAGKTQEEQIRILRDLKHDWPTIGKLVGMNANAARVRYSRIKNGKHAK